MPICVSCRFAPVLRFRDRHRFLRCDSGDSSEPAGRAEPARAADRLGEALDFLHLRSDDPFEDELGNAVALLDCERGATETS